MKPIILSIKPQFSRQIFQGNKTVELRKSIGKSVTKGTSIYIYSSSPIQTIEGKATIDYIEHFDVTDKQTLMTQAGCITQKDYLAYYKNRTLGVGLWLKAIERFTHPVPLQQLKHVGFTPPQSFTYGTHAIWEVIKSAEKKR